MLETPEESYHSSVIRTYKRLFNCDYRIFLTNCKLYEKVLTAGLSIFGAGLEPGSHELGFSFAPSDKVCKVLIPEELNSDTGLIITSLIELEIITRY